MAKQSKNQMGTKKNPEGIAQEFTPKTDTEYANEFPYHAPEKGMNKRQQQQSKQK